MCSYTAYTANSPFYASLHDISELPLTGLFHSIPHDRPVIYLMLTNIQPSRTQMESFTQAPQNSQPQVFSRFIQNWSHCSNVIVSSDAFYFATSVSPLCMVSGTILVSKSSNNLHWIFAFGIFVTLSLQPLGNPIHCKVSPPSTVGRGLPAAPC
jgi:hypothetical protein